MTRLMAIVVVPVLCALFTGCSTSSNAKVGSGADALKWRHRSVAEKFADFAKQGWTVTSKELDAKKKSKTVPGSNGVFMTENPNFHKNNPLNNSVWSTNFKVDGQKDGRLPGVNMVNGGGHGAVNMVGPDGRVGSAAKNNGVNVVGPAGMAVKGNVPQKGKGGLEVSGPAGTGTASVGTKNGLPTVGTVNVMGPDGKVHTVKRDLGADTERLLAPAEKALAPAEKWTAPVLSR